MFILFPQPVAFAKLWASWSLPSTPGTLSYRIHRLVQWSPPSRFLPLSSASPPCSPCRLNLSHEHEHYPKRSQVVQENTLKSSLNTICETHAQNMLDNHLQNADTGSSQNGRVPPRWEFQWDFGGSKFRDNPKSSPKFLAHVKTWRCIRVNVDNESIHHLYVP